MFLSNSFTDKKILNKTQFFHISICDYFYCSISDTTLSVPSSQTEHSKTDNQGGNKVHSLSGKNFDVLFLNCDTQSEKNWVLKARDVLENNHSLHCGCAEIGDDNEDYFKNTSEVTKIIMTFTEQSSKRKPAILSVNDLVVAVMVEECSIPIQHGQMKCVDATKDDNEWLDQLLTALNLRYFYLESC